MSDNRRLIVVSNRLPVALKREGEGWQATRSAGGLATAMDPVLKDTGGIWIGWSGSPDEPEELRNLLREEHGCITVPLPEDIAEGFYEGYSNQALWPLFHSLTTGLNFDPTAWSAYKEANQRFCDVVAEQYKPGDRIWVHDYHLMLLPKLLRQRLPDAAVGFFLHIPFPASDIFSLLPRGDELLEGLLGADLIAFHTHAHLQHFRRSVRRLLGIESKVDLLEVEGRTVGLQALPIGIAPDEFLGYLDQEDTQEQYAALEKAYTGKKVLVAIDRLDYTKGLPNRLRTYARLLKSEPELCGAVVLVQVAVPSRENIESYQELTNEVNQLIGEINGEFGTAHWSPIVYIHRGIPRAELVALYHRADVAWVSPLRDGMNLVAKEYVACKPDGKGVLVLSWFAGAAAEMGEALLVNPYDEERTAAMVSRALRMEDQEKQERMLALHARVIRNNVFRWGETFLAALDDSAGSRLSSVTTGPASLPADRLLAAYRQATKRVLLLDYDGTLVPFVSRPQDAQPDEGLLDILAQLSADDANEVVLISGRKISDLEKWFGHIRTLGIAGEHGARWRASHSGEWHSSGAQREWKNSVRSILDHFTDRTPGSSVEEKEFALVWHYRMAEPEFADWLATELVAMLDGMLAETELRAYRGNKIVEVKPLLANKGAFTARYLQEHRDADFVLAIGDDRTDEDMFSHLPATAWSIRVGRGESKATYTVPDVRSVRRLVRELAEVRQRTSPFKREL
jgi:trehalose 6-phosphate synthase/phosphatase